MKAVAALFICVVVSGSLAATPASTPATAPAVDAGGGRLPAGAVARYGATRLMHESFPWTAIVAPDKSVIATADQEGRLYVWDTSTAQRLWMKADAGRSVTTMAFSPDCRTLAAAIWKPGPRAGHVIELFETRTGKSIATLESNNPNQAVTAMIFTPGGDKIILGESTIRVLGVPKGDLQAEYKGVFGVMGLAISPDGNTLAAGGNGANVPVWLWDLTTGKDRRIPMGGQNISALAFGPDGRQLAVSMNEWAEQTKPEPNKPAQTVRHPAGTVVLDLDTGQRIATLDAHQVMQFLPDGKTMLTQKHSTSTGQFQLHEVNTLTWQGRPLGMSTGDRTRPTQQVLSADGKMMVSVAQQGVLRLRTVPDGNSVFPGPPPQGPVQKLAVSNDGALVALANSQVSWGAASDKENIPAVMIYDANGAFLCGLDGGTTGACDVAFSHDSRMLAAACGDGALRLWNTADWSPVKPSNPANVNAYNRPLAEIQFTRDGRLLTLARDGRVALLEPATGRLLGDRPAYDANYIRAASLAASPLARVTAILAGWRILFWDAPKGAADSEEIDSRNIANASCIRISPDGLLLALSGVNDTVDLLEVATRRPVRTLRASSAAARSAVFSPDGRLVAAASGEDKGARIWTIETGKEIATLRGHTRLTLCVAFAPDGLGLITGSSDTTALRWDISRSVAPAPPPASPQDLDKAWDELADRLGPAAWAAQKTILAAGQAGAALLADRIKPLAVDRAAVARQILDLDAEEFQLRENASVALADVSDMILPDLKTALAGAFSAELKTRLSELIEHAGNTQSAGGERLRLIRACWLLQLAGGDDAKRGLAKLASAKDASRLVRDAKTALAAMEK